MGRKSLVFLLVICGCTGTEISAPAPVQAPEATAPVPRGATVVHGTVVGYDGKPTPRAEIRVIRQAGQDPEVVVVDRRGRFSIELDHQGLAAVEVSAANHATSSIPVVLEGGSIALDIKLGTYERADPMTSVQALVWEGDPDATEPQVVDMAIRADGKWHANIETKARTLTYQLLGPAAGRTVAGMQANRFDYDGSGDYRSVVYVRGDEFEFVVDPDELVPAGRSSEIQVGEAGGPTDRLITTLRPAADAMAEFELALFEARTPAEAVETHQSFDWAPVARHMRTAISLARHPDVRRMLIGKYFELPLPDAYQFDGDRRLAAELLETMDADDPGWALFPQSISGAVRLAGTPEDRQRYAELLDEELPADLAAPFLFGELLTAEQSGDDAEVENVFARLNRPERFGETGIIELASSHDPNGALAAGKVLPSFSVDAKAGATPNLDNASLQGRVTLIDFWSPSCGPCLKEMENLHAAHEQFGGQRQGRPFQIVSISVDAEDGQIADFRRDKSHAMPWRHGSTSFDQAAEAFGIRTIPYAILVDEDGRILASGQGLAGDGLSRVLSEHLEAPVAAEPSQDSEPTGPIAAAGSSDLRKRAAGQ